MHSIVWPLNAAALASYNQLTFIILCLVFCFLFDDAQLLNSVAPKEKMECAKSTSCAQLKEKQTGLASGSFHFNRSVPAAGTHPG